MTDLFDAIRKSLVPKTHIGRVGGGFVPQPSKAPPHREEMGLIVNCELCDVLRVEEADRILDILRNDAVGILRELYKLRLDDTTRVCVRFGYYSGVQLRETVYACNVPTSYLSEAALTKDFAYWTKYHDPDFPVEYSTIGEIDALLKRY